MLVAELFPESGLDFSGAKIDKALYSPKRNLLTVEISSEDPLSDEAQRYIDAGLENLYHGLHVRTVCRSRSVPNAAPRVPVSAQNAPVAADQYAFVSASAPGKQDPDVLYGKRIEDAEPIALENLTDEIECAVICGRLLSGELRESWGRNREGNKTYNVRFNVTDDTNSIAASVSFYNEAKAQRFFAAVEPFFGKDQYLMLRGKCRFPRNYHELTMYVNDVMLAEHEQRMDTCEEKRVELHMHSRMSTMDGLTDVTKAFQTAKRFGHKALAITDHGVVQAFPEAAKASKKTGVKVIFGVEGYLLPDTDLMETDVPFVVFDIETTGLKAERCDIIEIGAIRVENKEITGRFQTFINDGVIIPTNITQLTGITTDMLAGAPSLREVLTDFQKFCEGACLVAHNAKFDVGFIHHHSAKFGIEFPNPYADTLMLSKYLLHDLPNHKLDTLCEHFNVDLTNHHRAIDDATATAEVFLKMLGMLSDLRVSTVPVYRPEPAEEQEKHGKKGRQKTNHIIILAKTQPGMKNLYRLVSYAHLDFFRTRPIIPFSLLSIYRDGLILGSACEQGELYQAILHGKTEEQIEKIAAYYDYLEIQPDGNNAFMVREQMVPDYEALHDINRKIIALGDRLGKPVVATGDVHFLEPQDAAYRKILMSKLGFKDCEFQAPLYFKTTDEMLSDFAYLGEELARKVVIEAPNAIAEMVEELKPFPDGTHAPEIPNASEELESMAVNEAHRIYGDPLPPVVQARLDKELKSIIGNGYASLYLMAQRLVHKSLSDGYLVGSRGSVGSSFVATMAGITEVNPLQPHYVCENPECKHSEFDVRPEGSNCGIDLPDKLCPVCGQPLSKRGFEIPFEVFLGFKGDKTPDIDLNFSGEYQPRAHKYVEEMFGVGHAFRAGTISGLAEKKAFECVFKYEEATGKHFSNAEKERLSKGCMNVKVTTGQHPGGIVIVPQEDDILDYTPVQYPADKTDSKTITTHFDFHAMDDRLVKLDILGHDDPTALRMLEDITHLNPRSIPLDDPDTRSLFSSSKALGCDLSEINCTTGSLAVPEFGTGFVRGVLESTNPTTMEEFIRISGLTHGTDVWLNNAEPLVTNGIAKLSEVLCTRDDIMNYLIAHDMDPGFSFKTMEQVRKGRGLTEEMEQTLRDGNIPEWFIDSCKKIKYMFPRGHAVAYVTMAFRIAYYKVHYPLAFYSVYFTARADAFDVTLASGGAESVLKTIREINSQGDLTDAEKKRNKEITTFLEVVYEMNLRGIELLPVDIYKSHAQKFLIEGNAIRPPFNAIPGIGLNASISMAENRGDQRFVSIKDFQTKTGANSGVISAMKACGCFGDMPEENQISLF